MTGDIAPFHAGSTISEQQYFVGYRDQLNMITVRAVSAQPTSINVIGEHRIGKSSLLFHFCQTYEDRIRSRGQDPTKFLAVYLSLQQGNCQSQSGFYQVIATELARVIEQRYSWFNLRQRQKLLPALKANSFDTESFSATILQFRHQGILPIICLDKIEALFNLPAEFNNGFYDNLRSLMDKSALMLVIASHQELKIYSGKKKLTSDFFNVGQVIKLEGYTENEARDLVRLPQTNISSSRAVLSQEEQTLARQWGMNHPYLLQLAGLCLWDAQRLNRDLVWAKQEFEQRQAGTNISRHKIKRFKRGFRRILLMFCGFFPSLIGVAENLGNIVGKVIAIAIGLTFILLLMLAIFGKIPWIRIPQQFGDFLCSTLSSVLGEYCQDDSSQ